MKKRLTIISLSVMTVLSLYGCSTAVIEKEPVVIQDTTEDLDESASETLMAASEENQDNGDALEVEGQDTSSSLEEDVVNTSEKDTATTSGKDSTPEKGTTSEEENVDLSIQVEGMEEKINARLNKSSLNYQIAYDTDRFKLSGKEDIDIYQAENPNPDMYPFVYMNISKVVETEFDKYTEVFHKKLKQEQNEVERKDDIKIGEYNGVQLIVRTGNEWNSAVRKYYIIDDEDSVYLIETQYFVEAEEGYGARMSAMLDTFKITK